MMPSGCRGRPARIFSRHDSTGRGHGEQRKHALITGSSRGIGRGIALKLAGQGVNVAINYRKNEAARRTPSPR